MHIISLRKQTQFACVHNIGIKLYTYANHKLGWLNWTYSILYTAISVSLFKSLHPFLFFILSLKYNTSLPLFFCFLALILNWLWVKRFSQNQSWLLWWQTWSKHQKIQTLLQLNITKILHRPLCVLYSVVEYSLVAVFLWEFLINFKLYLSYTLTRLSRLSWPNIVLFIFLNAVDNLALRSAQLRKPPEYWMQTSEWKWGRVRRSSFPYHLFGWEMPLRIS